MMMTCEAVAVRTNREGPVQPSSSSIINRNEITSTTIRQLWKTAQTMTSNTKLDSSRVSFDNFMRILNMLLNTASILMYPTTIEQVATTTGGEFSATHKSSAEATENDVNEFGFNATDLSFLAQALAQIMLTLACVESYKEVLIAHCKSDEQNGLHAINQLVNEHKQAAYSQVEELQEKLEKKFDQKQDISTYIYSALYTFVL